MYEGRFGYAVCSLCNYATEEGLDICRTCVASTTYVNPENYEDWTEEEIRRLDPFKEICVDKWLEEKGYSGCSGAQGGGAGLEGGREGSVLTGSSVLSYVLLHPWPEN